MTQPDDASSRPKAEPEAPASSPDAPRAPRAWGLVGLAVLGVVLLTTLDLWTKTLAEEHLARVRQGSPPALCEPDERGYVGMQRLRGEPYVVVEDILDFEYAENCGAAFGMMRDAPEAARAGVFGLAAIIAVSALFYLFRTGRGGPLLAWGVPFVASGALGNLIDRIRYGYVVDFIHVHYEPWDFDYPTFNVADVTITIGVALLVLDAFRAERAPDATTKPGGGSKAPDARAVARAAAEEGSEADAPSGGAVASAEEEGGEEGTEVGSA